MKYCKVCHDAGKEDYAHHLKDNNGTVICPYLLSIKCNYCKKNGHTIKHCPDANANAKANAKKEKTYEEEDDGWTHTKRQQQHGQAKQQSPLYCKFCHDAGKSYEEYTSHYVKSSLEADAVVTCPILLEMECRKCGVKGHTPKECRASASASAPYELKRTYTTFGITSTPQVDSTYVEKRKQKVEEDEYEEKKGYLAGRYIFAKIFDTCFNVEYAKDELFNSDELRSIDSNDTKRLRAFFYKYYKDREHKEHLYITNCDGEDNNSDDDEYDDEMCNINTKKNTWASRAAQAPEVQTNEVVTQAQAVQQAPEVQTNEVVAQAHASAEAVSGEQAPKVPSAKSWASLASKKLESAPPAPHKVKEVLLGIKTQPQPELTHEDDVVEMPFDFQPVDENIYNRPEKRSWVEMCDDDDY